MNPNDLTPVEWELGGLRRELARLREAMQIRQVDADGSLADLWRVLRQKRGCRR